LPAPGAHFVLRQHKFGAREILMRQKQFREGVSCCIRFALVRADGEPSFFNCATSWPM
jgi:hypothetical protein